MLWIVVGMLQIFGRSLMYPNHKKKKDISGAFWDGLIIGLWAIVIFIRIALLCGAKLNLEI